MTLQDPLRNDPEGLKARRRRNLAIAIGLLAFVAIVFTVTLVRLGANVLDRPL